MFDFGCGDGGACDGGGDGGAGGAGGMTSCDIDYTTGYAGQFQFGYNESAADMDVTCVDMHYSDLHYHESADVASYFDSWYSSSTAGDIWWRKIAIPIMCGIIFVFILVFSFKVTKAQLPPEVPAC